MLASAPAYDDFPSAKIVQQITKEGTLDKKTWLGMTLGFALIGGLPTGVAIR